MEALERLKDQMRAMGMSIAKAVSDRTSIILITTPIPFHQEMCIHDLNFELAKLKSTDSVDSAQVETAASYKDWRDIKSVNVSVQKDLSSLLLSGRTQKGKLEKLESEKIWEAQNAFEKYFEQGEPRKGHHQTDLMENLMEI